MSAGLKALSSLCIPNSTVDPQINHQIAGESMTRDVNREMNTSIVFENESGSSSEEHDPFLDGFTGKKQPAARISTITLPDGSKKTVENMNIGDRVYANVKTHLYGRQRRPSVLQNIMVTPETPKISAQTSRYEQRATTINTRTTTLMKERSTDLDALNGPARSRIPRVAHFCYNYKHVLGKYDSDNDQTGGSAQE